jgi:hypothetical protein
LNGGLNLAFRTPTRSGHCASRRDALLMDDPAVHPNDVDGAGEPTNSAGAIMFARFDAVGALSHTSWLDGSVGCRCRRTSQFCKSLPALRPVLMPMPGESLATRPPLQQWPLRK